MLSLLAPLALLLPTAQAVVPVPDEAARAEVTIDEDWQFATVVDGPPLAASEASPIQSLRPMAEGFRPDRAWQVRIEQRLVIRIAPRGDMFPDIPSGPVGPRFTERKTGKCLAVQGIAGVQVMDDRLVLFMRDRRIIGANLEKSCRPRDFYSGFYVEHTSDGQICAGRDEVHSRAGATCAITGLRELIPN